MRQLEPCPTPHSRRALAVVALLLVGLLAGCDDGSDGKKGPPGPPGPAGDPGPTDTVLVPTEDAPGVNIEITGVSGASGASGQFLPGDTLSVTFTLLKDDGSAWAASEMNRLRALVSGPTFNYQRVLAEVTDLPSMAVSNGGGSYTYTFATPIPATYLPPLNDTASFDDDDGELTGEALLDGTYTVGVYARWVYTVEGESFIDVGDDTLDFMLGASGPITPREVVGMDNCNTCHAQLQAHGGFRQNVTICLMCHTSGSEDRNTGGVTPGASVDFKIMIHKIHNGAHLPSVLGVTTNPDGSRDYDATPQPYTLVGFNTADFSEVQFPVWPSLSFPTLRDSGYSALTSDQQALENQMRGGVVSCDKCHGDPDGDGPQEAPAQGVLAYQQPTRNACGSCHDDVIWEFPYTANGQTMPEQATDSACVLCHEVQGSGLDVIDAHRHPLLDPALNPGLNFEITDVAEAGSFDGDGALDPGEKIAISFTVTDDAGGAVDPLDIASMSVAISGPTSNLNLVLNGAFPTGALAGGPDYTLNVPETRLLEFLGDSTGAGGETFATTGAPHWNALGAATTVNVAEIPAPGPTVGDSALSTSMSAFSNFVDVDDASGFERNDHVVIDAGLMGAEEYLRIQFVDGNRLWFGSPATSGYPPALRFDHTAGAPVEEVTLTQLVEDTDYSLDDPAGEITEIMEFGAGAAVVVSYTTDFVVPDTYGLPLNDSPDLDDSWGEWKGKSLVDGTYLLALWGYRSLSITEFGETNSYRGASMDDAAEFVIGEPAPIEPWEGIASAETCLDCHDELRFHGGTRAGFDTCLVCHGTAGSEDRPQYVAANAPATTGTSIDFKQMLHKIHMGADLANASSYTLVGFGPVYPNNFSTHQYDEVHFPAYPAGPMDCVKCHGASDAWIMPESNDHPTMQDLPAREWRNTCSSCHDSEAAMAHIESNTGPVSGAESCAICHDPGQSAEVELAHKVR